MQCMQPGQPKLLVHLMGSMCAAAGTPTARSSNRCLHCGPRHIRLVIGLAAASNTCTNDVGLCLQCFQHSASLGTAARRAGLPDGIISLCGAALYAAHCSIQAMCHRANHLWWETQTRRFRQLHHSLCQPGRRAEYKDKEEEESACCSTSSNVLHTILPNCQASRRVSQNACPPCRFHP